MAQESARFLLDGQTDFSGGQDASKNPDKVPPNCYFSGINTTCRNGSLGPRDGLKLLSWEFPEGGLELPGRFPIPYQQIFESGKFQAIVPYTIGAEPYLILVVSGVIFLFNPQTYRVTVLPIADGLRLNEYASRINWSFASRFIVLFDFPALPVIIENATARRADPTAFEVPISTLGAYNENRLFIANAGNEFTGGDPVGVGFPNAPITFEEISAPGFPYIGQIFQLPTDYGNQPITYMGFLSQIDTSTGIGPLILGTEEAIYAANTQNPRSTWQDGPFTSKIVANSGIAGPRAGVNLNSDFFFMSPDGQIRSLSMSRDEQKKWSRSPISREVRNWIKFHKKDLVRFTAMTYFNDTIFCTVNPYRVIARTLLQEPISDYTHGGMVALELSNLGTLREEASPAWGGLWTGIRPMDFCVQNDRCFVVSKDNETVNRIWEITPNNTVDEIEDKLRYVKSTIYTKNYDFEDPFLNKELIYGDFPFENVRGDFKFDIKFRSSQSAQFLPWRSFRHKAPYKSCKMPKGCAINGLVPHNFRELRFGWTDTDACDPVTKDLYRFFREVQFKLEIEGRDWELTRFKLKAVSIPESDTATVCTEYPKVELCKVCDTDWQIPPLEDCVEKETEL